MAKMLKKNLGLLFCAGIVAVSTPVFAQKKATTANTNSTTAAPTVDPNAPIEAVKKIGDRIIRNTPFQFQLDVNKRSRNFDFLEFVDFSRSFGKLQQAAVAFAVTEINVPRDTTVGFEISHNDDLQLILNGKVEYQKKGVGPVNLTFRERDIVLSESFKVKLKKGNNRLVIKSFAQANRENWIFYLRPQGATIEFSEVRNIKVGLDEIPNISEDVKKLSNWLIVGPIKHEGKPIAESTYGPENKLTVGEMYEGVDGNKVTWQLPKVEVFGGLINSHPLWGTYYSYNYHAAGVAWAMANLAKVSGEPRFADHCRRYCDFILGRKPFIDYQVNGLNGFRSAQHHQFNTPLLDFTTAPALPFVWSLHEYSTFSTRAMYQKFVDSIKFYVFNHQVKLPDGTFTRETPEKYTTWVDDMFMGIPFLVHAAVESTTPSEKAKFFDEAASQVLGFHKNVYDFKANLYHHAQYSNRKVFIPHWGRANGWGIWAATEVLLHLPKNHKHYKAILKIYRDHVGALVKLQANNGFWHQVLDDPTSYQETSGTAIFTMALARGINNGWLDRKTFAPYAFKGWEALKTTFGPEGTVENICVGTMSSETADYYKTRPAVPDDSHGLLGVLFAGMEMDKLYKSTKK